MVRTMENNNIGSTPSLSANKKAELDFLSNVGLQPVRRTDAPKETVFKQSDPPSKWDVLYSEQALTQVNFTCDKYRKCYKTIWKRYTIKSTLLAASLQRVERLSSHPLVLRIKETNVSKIRKRVPPSARKGRQTSTSLRAAEDLVIPEELENCVKFRTKEDRPDTSNSPERLPWWCGKGAVSKAMRHERWATLETGLDRSSRKKLAECEQHPQIIVTLSRTSPRTLARYGCHLHNTDDEQSSEDANLSISSTAGCDGNSASSSSSYNERNPSPLTALSPLQETYSSYSGPPSYQHSGLHVERVPINGHEISVLSHTKPPDPEEDDTDDPFSLLDLDLTQVSANCTGAGVMQQTTTSTTEDPLIASSSSSGSGSACLLGDLDNLLLGGSDLEMQNGDFTLNLHHPQHLPSSEFHDVLNGHHHAHQYSSCSWDPHSSIDLNLMSRFDSTFSPSATSTPHIHHHPNCEAIRGHRHVHTNNQLHYPQHNAPHLHHHSHNPLPIAQQHLHHHHHHHRPTPVVADHTLSQSSSPCA